MNVILIFLMAKKMTLKQIPAEVPIRAVPHLALLDALQLFLLGELTFLAPARRLPMRK